MLEKMIFNKKSSQKDLNGIIEASPLNVAKRTTTRTRTKNNRNSQRGSEARLFWPFLLVSTSLCILHMVNADFSSTTERCRNALLLSDYDVNKFIDKEGEYVAFVSYMTGETFPNDFGALPDHFQTNFLRLAGDSEHLAIADSLLLKMGDKGTDLGVFCDNTVRAAEELIEATSSVHSSAETAQSTKSSESATHCMGSLCNSDPKQRRLEDT